MPVQIDLMPLGMLQTNCYVVGDTDQREAVIIDPSGDAPAILAQIKQRDYTVREILITHTHFDHVLALAEVKAATGAPIAMHPDGLDQLRNLSRIAAMYGIPYDGDTPDPDRDIAHGDVIEFGGIRLEARFTPGHSPGHITFVMAAQKIAFVGDCIFNNGFGRTDLPGSDEATLRQSIVEQILTLPDDFSLCSGHGPVTTVGQEKMHSAPLAYLLGR